MFYSAVNDYALRLQRSQSCITGVEGCVVDGASLLVLLYIQYVQYSK